MILVVMVKLKQSLTVQFDMGDSLIFQFKNLKKFKILKVGVKDYCRIVEFWKQGKQNNLLRLLLFKVLPIFFQNYVLPENFSCPISSFCKEGT